MKLVYTAAPITRGNQWHNGAQAGDAMLTLMKAGIAVINPMLSMWCGVERHVVQTFDPDATELIPVGPSAKAHGGFRELSHQDWLDMDFEIIRRCDAVLRLPGESSGADAEVAHAESLGIPVFYDIAEVIWWCNL
jgi:hypothetical protein